MKAGTYSYSISTSTRCSECGKFVAESNRITWCVNDACKIKDQIFNIAGAYPIKDMVPWPAGIFAEAAEAYHVKDKFVLEAWDKLFRREENMNPDSSDQPLKLTPEQELELLLFGRTIVAATIDPGPKVAEETLSSNAPYVTEASTDMSGLIKKVTREYTPSAHTSKGLTFEDMVSRGLHRYSPATIAQIRIKEERERREKNKRRKEG